MTAAVSEGVPERMEGHTCGAWASVRRGQGRTHTHAHTHTQTQIRTDTRTHIAQLGLEALLARALEDKLCHVGLHQPGAHGVHADVLARPIKAKLDG